MQISGVVIAANNEIYQQSNRVHIHRLSLSPDMWPQVSPLQNVTLLEPLLCFT